MKRNKLVAYSKLSISSFTILLFSLLLVSFQGMSQTVSVVLGKTDIGQNENFEITLTVKNGRLTKYSSFPDIPGFRKGRPSSSSQTSIVNGQVSTQQSITQLYQPTKQGTFKLNAFTMTVNGKSVSNPGTTIKVGVPVQRQVYDPFADFWGGGSSFGKQQQEQDFIDVKADAFYSVSTDKSSVYRGEGFRMDVSFYVSVTNRAELEFYKIDEQVTKILKQVKPRNCWEENFNIESIHPEYVTINGKSYRQYKIYEAMFYPLNSEDIVIPPTELEMIKYQVAQRQSFFGRNRKEDHQIFKSRGKTIKVKPLPDNPLKSVASVGNYRLREEISTAKLKTGESVTLEFRVEGEGNISSIREPSLKETEDLLFYPPSVSQNINRANGRVVGAKTYQYYIEPQEPGEYNLGEYIELPIFNPRTKKYEMLHPEVTIVVEGKSLRDAQISKTDLGSFYDAMRNADNSIVSMDNTNWIQIILNIFVVISIGLTIFFLVKKF
ncbi:BatD family protein [Flammeovirga agarivorans]|uniref:Protein BatD n=1 Tax=Flammeovirga agarivorans TaxID=2726742 RepID=A0A7X8SMB1_9BACT|nr:BatD family protein [Flammeovirga agarivorans]NLR92848.1 protein BatD [Flammeovirga agarivorans]